MIEVERLSFAYADAPVLRDVSLLAPDDEGLARACEYLEQNLKPARPELFPEHYAPLQEGMSLRP